MPEQAVKILAADIAGYSRLVLSDEEERVRAYPAISELMFGAQGVQTCLRNTGDPNRRSAKTLVCRLPRPNVRMNQDFIPA
jgi:hypothetical protein